MEVTMNVVRTDEAPWAPLLDVSGQPVELLDLGDDSIVGRCLNQIMKSLDDPNGVLSAFGSFVSEH